MIPSKQDLQAELLRQWQPYGPIAAFWAIQLADAMWEFNRVMTLNTALAASLDEQALCCQIDDVSEDVRWHHAIFTAFHNEAKTIRLLKSLNDQAMRRLNQIQRTLNIIKKEAQVPVEPEVQPVSQAQPSSVKAPRHKPSSRIDPPQMPPLPNITARPDSPVSPPVTAAA